MMVIAGVPPRFMTLLAVVGSLGLAAAMYLDLLQKYQIDRFISFSNQNSTNPALAQADLRGQQRQKRDWRGRHARGGSFPRPQTMLGYVPEQ